MIFLGAGDVAALAFALTNRYSKEHVEASLLETISKNG
jgi:hypothetical protein